MTRSYPKPIFCIESFWDKRLRDIDRQSVRPLLEVLRATGGVPFIHLTSSTHDELEFNLRQTARYRSYRVLYLAFHGSTGSIHLADGSEIDVEDLAGMMPDQLKDWFVHFTACSVVRDAEKLRRFMQATGASMVTGYTRDVDWVESAAMDLLVLDWAQEYRNPRSFVRKLKNTYSGLIAETGLDAVYRR